MMKNKLVKIALIQLDVGPNKKANLKKAERHCLMAAKRKVDFICLPEMFNWMGKFKKSREAEEDENGQSIKMLKNIAKKYACYIVGGSIMEKRKRGLPLNTTFFIDRTGKITARYSKMHLFDLNIEGDITYLESKAMSRGSAISTAKTRFGKVGFAICADLRYPEIFRKLMLAGCKIIFVQSAFTRRTGREHWHALNKVRALENQLYIVATNQCGHNADGVKYFGHSMVVSPWGRIIAEAKHDREAILYSKVDLSKIDKIRNQMPTLKKIHKRY